MPLLPLSTPATSPDTSVNDENMTPEAKVPPLIFWYVGSFAVAAVLISLASIWKQIKNYRRPVRLYKSGI
jgi:hypothetical protein